MGDRMRKSGRLYVGNLPTDANNDDIEDLFSRYGRIVDLVVKRATNGAQFAFVEFSDSHDAEDAIKSKDGASFMGSRLRVEYPRGRRDSDTWGRRSGGGGDRGGGGGGGGGGMRRGDYRVYIRNMPSTGSWQDLKDHMREAGDCAFADVSRDGTGVVEFTTREAMDYALRKLDGTKFRCHQQGNSSRITVSREPFTRRGRDSRSRSRGRRSADRRRRSRSPTRSGSAARGGPAKPSSRSPSPRGRSPAANERSQSPRDKSAERRGRSASPAAGGGSREGSAGRGRSRSKSPPADR